ncbi:hypothetical protein [Burkholderia sp. BCC0405]|uniref:hypothetical protein n=1 Tax=Burkholderia sp. BCC0405 TaxID=2676298 RepID=UPI001588DA59|nr:hypothetical protein [Burkholderia sp. BCC0405]
MAENYGKLWIQGSANQLAINRAQQAIQNTGRALPCHVVAVNGAIVTVAFDVNASPQTLPNVTIPKAESPWVRMPTQVGDKGITMPGDVYLGGISGLGGGTANMTRTGNLTALVFVPVSNSNSAPINQNMAQIQGPSGVILQTADGNVALTLNESGITIKIGSETFTWGASGVNFPVPITTPDVIVPNGSVNGHYHGGVQTGTGNTGGMTG